MEERQHLGTTIENNKITLPNEADVLVSGECQINSTGTEVIEVKSTNCIQNQELLDNKYVSLTAKLTFCLVCGIFPSFLDFYLVDLIILFYRTR